MRLPEVTGQQIDGAAAALGLECDAQRRTVLSHRDTIDVRACAGSGKTTLLVAKLAVLLDDWNEPCRGVCILSHTNVAHEEIRRRFSLAPRLRALEAYPHYLGTIQSFVNTFLGIPGCLVKYGVRPSVIDDELFAARASRVLLGQSYATLRGWLGRQSDGEEILSRVRLVEEDGALTISSVAYSRLSEDSPSRRALNRLKQTLIDAGVFRYDDMDAVGSWYIKQVPTALAAIRHRFPFVFVDETQDTAARQALLLDRVFQPGSVIQRFGDDRQAIYRGAGQEEPGAEFPKAGFLSMSTSLRVSPTIARLAEHVCVGNVEPLSGRPDAPAHGHTVFVFAKDRIEEVLPAFARLVASELGSGLPAHRVMAVGFRRQGSGDPDKVPLVLGDYWKGSIPLRRPLTARFDYLAEYISAAKCDLAVSRGVGNARIRLLQAACRMLELQELDDAGRPFSPSRVVKKLQDVDHGRSPSLLISVSKAILRLVEGIDVLAGTLASEFRQALVHIYSGEWNAGVSAFCDGPTPEFEQTKEATAQAGDGVFRLETDQGQIQVGLSTIHGVKGETMDATLVLTTYFYCHDLAQLIAAGPLRGHRPTATKAQQVRFQDNVKRIYVAMTRPTRLLCLAIRDDHVTPAQRTEMEQLGWRFQTV